MEIKQDIDNVISAWFEGLYFNVSAVPGLDAEAEASHAILEHYLVKLLTSLVVNVAAAWWSIKELWDYLSNRQSFKEIVSNGSRRASGNFTDPLGSTT